MLQSQNCANVMPVIYLFCSPGKIAPREKESSAALLTLEERMTRQQHIRKISSRSRTADWPD